MREEEKKNKPTFILVPRKLMITWISSYVMLLVLLLASFQYTNYVDRRSNGSWCSFFNVLDTNPIPSQNQEERNRRSAFDSLKHKLGC